MARPRFDAAKSLVAARSFTYDGKEHHKGDTFVTDGLPSYKLRTLYDARYVNHPDAVAPAAATPDDVQIKEAGRGSGGGFYDVSAPWLEKPERIRGKAAAQARVDQLKAEGPPLGFIAGGSEVTVEEQDGKFTVSAPWLDGPEEFDTRDEAEARQRELHGLGEPDLHHGVRLTDGGNGWFEVKPDWGDTEKFEDGAAARSRATELREQGPPEIEEVSPWEASVIVAIDGDKFTVTAPGQEPQTFDTAEQAETRQKELRAAGPPEGWQPPAGPTE